MGERGVRNAEVRGSIPLISTIIYFHFSCYIFRIRVPGDITPHLGKIEIRRSVKTRSRIKAIQRGIRMFTTIQSIFKETRKGGRMTELIDIFVEAQIFL